MSSTLFLEPLDGWSFRDGRPFEAGEAFEATSLFPPSPWTTLGCLRTAALRSLCPDPERYAGRNAEGSCPECGRGPCAAERVVGAAGGDPPFHAGPPLLARRAGARAVDIFYPVPADLACSVEGGVATSRLLTPVDCPSGVAHALGQRRPVTVLAPGRLHPWHADGPWLNGTELTRCLAGNAEDGLACRSARHGHPSGGEIGERPTIYREPRIGVGIDPETRGIREGQLYLRDVVRLDEGVGLAVSVEPRLQLDGEIGRLGGDGRMVRFHAVEAPTPPRRPDRFDAPRLKVYLASPTWFEGGWRPRWIDPDRLEGTPPGLTARLRLVATAIGDSPAVGGWDLKTQRPRPMLRLVGAGAVYFFEIVTGDVGAVAEGLHGQPFCDDPSLGRAGFGLALVGRY